jgi:hypothetical protein
VCNVVSKTNCFTEERVHAGCRATSRTMAELVLCGWLSSIWHVTSIKVSSSCCAFLQRMKQGVNMRHRKPPQKIYDVEMPSARESTEDLVITIVSQDCFTSKISNFRQNQACFIDRLFTHSHQEQWIYCIHIIVCFLCTMQLRDIMHKGNVSFKYYWNWCM